METKGIRIAKKWFDKAGELIVERHGAEKLRAAEKKLCGTCLRTWKGKCVYWIRPLTLSGENCLYHEKRKDSEELGDIPGQEN